MRRRGWAKAALAGASAVGIVVVMWHLGEARLQPLPSRPYRDVTMCARGPLKMALLDANGDEYPDLAILCVEELVVLSGVDGDTLWRTDLPRPLFGSHAVGKFLVTDGRKVVTVAYPEALASFDAATGRALWTRRLTRDVIYEVDAIAIDEDCIAVEHNRNEPSTFHPTSGQSASCEVAPRNEGPPVLRVSAAKDDAEDEHGEHVRVVTLERSGEPVWTVPCGWGHCQPTLMAAGVLVESEWGEARCGRIFDVSTGRVTRVLEPQDAPWEYRSLPPYLVAWRMSDPEPPYADHPILEVFSAASLETRWRTDPDLPPSVWRRGDRCRTPPPYASERSAMPLACSDAYEGPCATGITLRPSTGDDDVVFRLERGGCRGDCAVYRVEILADGRVRYEGRSVEGTPDGQIPREQLDELTSLFRDNGVFDLCDTEWQIADVSRTFLAFWDGARVKRVECDPFRSGSACVELANAVDRAVAIDPILPPPEPRRTAW